MRNLHVLVAVLVELSHFVQVPLDGPIPVLNLAVVFAAYYDILCCKRDYLLEANYEKIWHKALLKWEQPFFDIQFVDGLHSCQVPRTHINLEKL